MREELVAVLRRPRFAVVTMGEGLSKLGDAAFEVGLAWVVIQRTGSVTALAGFLLFRAVPRSVRLSGEAGPIVILDLSLNSDDYSKIISPL